MQVGKTHPNECPEYDIKQSDGKVPALKNVEYPFIAITLKSTQGPEW